MILRKFGGLIEPLKSCNFQGLLFFTSREVCKFSTEPVKSVSGSDSLEDKTKKISKAMRAYLQRANEHDEFMKKQKEEFQIGKRHLANMMGEDPETFTQEDIDNAIEYLFPSGLYEKKARPHMKPPEEVFPQRKAAEFDETGRPHHFLFYTGKPNFYQMLYNAVQYMNDIEKFEDTMIRKGLTPDPNLTLELSGYQWLDKGVLEKKLMESLGDKDYENFVSTFERLCQLPYSYKAKDFIFEFTKPLMNQIKTYDAPKAQYDSDGRAYVTTYECLRKTARGDVTIRMPGTGKITINGQDMSYFSDVQSREQLLFPLIFSNMLNKVDIECNIVGGGTSGQAGALRWGIAWGLRSFVDKDTIEKMRLAGLLTRDYRTKERKKPGQRGARRKYTWKKR
ncbi:LOW QUALITY PROTEIN: mitochondrial ribosomal protein S9 [Leptinotarsa decemlineata]|uniref:LOW QUALITY PROTEIN: mitochondrial ribosomal protein S9 n=1 Tax=Leptinotarsa decemlineata TaxID=7539 RepID=UPI000C25277B|nr:28S ribosomal protein S9, mitochondrial [Leptinotarsa decemlineata]